MVVEHATGDIDFQITYQEGFTIGYVYHQENGGTWTKYYKGSGGASMGEVGDTPLHHDPQFLMKAEREVQKSGHQEKPGGAIDPRPCEGGSRGGIQPPPPKVSSMQAGPIGAAGTEQKWKFAGRKPGSEGHRQPGVG